MVCGVDLAGGRRVVGLARWSAGDEVLATAGVSANRTPAAFTPAPALPREWLTARPARSRSRSACDRTAGLTAMLLRCWRSERARGSTPGGCAGASTARRRCRRRRRRHCSPGSAQRCRRDRPRAAPRVPALAGRPIRRRAQRADQPGRPLGSERWAGAIDSVGGQTLASVLANPLPRAVAACGLAGAPTCRPRCCRSSCAAEPARRRLGYVPERAAPDGLGRPSATCRRAAWTRSRPSGRSESVAEWRASSSPARCAGRVVIETAAGERRGAAHARDGGASPASAG